MALYCRSRGNSRFVPMKYMLILYMCSMITGQCPNQSIAGYQFTSHYDCVNAGYAVAQKTFRNLEALEEWDQSYINNNKIVIKPLGAKKTSGHVDVLKVGKRIRNRIRYMAANNDRLIKIIGTINSGLTIFSSAT